MSVEIAPLHLKIKVKSGSDESAYLPLRELPLKVLSRVRDTLAEMRQVALFPQGHPRQLRQHKVAASGVLLPAQAIATELA